LRSQRIVVATAATTAGGKLAIFLQGAVRGSFVGDDFIPVDCVGHDEHCTLGMLVLCVTAGWVRRR